MDERENKEQEQEPAAAAAEPDQPGAEPGPEPHGRKRASVEDQVPLTVHLTELRNRIMVCLGALFAASALAFAVNIRVIDFFAAPIGSLYFYGPSDAFMVRLKLAVLLGGLMAAPIILWELWLFVKPGLYDHEQRYARPLTLVSILLFYGGVAFGLQVLPLAVRVLVGFGTEHMHAALSLKKYVGFASFMLMAFGLVFQMPIVILFLTRFNIIRVETLRKHRRIAITFNLALAAILTPADVVSMIMMFVPLLILFEIGLFVSGRYMKKLDNMQKPSEASDPDGNHGR